MKKLIIAAAALMVSLAAYGQGQVTVNNKIAPDIDARLTASGDAAGTSSIGKPDWTVSLFGGPVGTAVTALKPLEDPNAAAGTALAPVAMRGAAGTAAAGYFNAGSPVVPGVAAGGNAIVQLRVNGPNGFTQSFDPVTVNGLGGGTITPPNLGLGTTPLTISLVPEPTTLALGALGLGSLLVLRRRK